MESPASLNENNFAAPLYVDDNVLTCMDSAKDGTDPHSRGVYKGWGTAVFAPNGCMIVHNINIFVISGVLKIAREKKNLLGGRLGIHPEHCRGSSRRFPTPHSWRGRGLLFSTQEPHPHPRFRPSALWSYPQ